MIGPNKIFVDTCAWIAYLLSKEPHHKLIRSCFFAEIKTGSKFFTSDYVLDECYTRLLTGQSTRSAQEFRKNVKQAEKQGNLLILWTDEGVFNRSWKNFIKFSEYKLSFTDATIVTFVKELKLNEVLTLDREFKKIGLSSKPILK